MRLSEFGGHGTRYNLKYCVVITDHHVDTDLISIVLVTGRGWDGNSCLLATVREKM